jgi:hypothetical protein
MVENKLVELKKAFGNQEKDINLPIFRTDDDSLAALRILAEFEHAYKDKEIPLV